ncbi:hypothetical protein CDL15_Pgr005384 [Punica granatum]|uniref:Uncharacterized protein n=1 Tax=Punica granatum TaxID=22663 RepID=A0A218XDG4_PUNGR|nr:hypothetical protein CDL15_Pgr005384 [Punica granatum]
MYGCTYDIYRDASNHAWERQDLDRVSSVSPVEVIGVVVRRIENPGKVHPSHYKCSYANIPAMACAYGLPEDTLYVEAMKAFSPRNP